MDSSNDNRGDVGEQKHAQLPNRFDEIARSSGSRSASSGSLRKSSNEFRKSSTEFRKSSTEFSPPSGSSNALGSVLGAKRSTSSSLTKQPSLADFFASQRRERRTGCIREAAEEKRRELDKRLMKNNSGKKKKVEAKKSNDEAIKPFQSKEKKVVMNSSRTFTTADLEFDHEESQDQTNFTAGSSSEVPAFQKSAVEKSRYWREHAIKEVESVDMEPSEAMEDRDNKEEKKMHDSMKSLMSGQSFASYKVESWIDAFGSWKNFRLFNGHIVNNKHVQVCIIALIVINAVMMGIGTFDFVTDNENVARGFESADMAFLIAFTIELLMQIIYRGWSLFADGWLVFDFLIVVFSWSLETMQIVRAFRVFRAFRLVARLKTLQNLVIALFDVAPSMSAIIALLVLILYIYAVLCTVLFGDLYAEGVSSVDYFSRLDTSIFTLFQMMTLEWSSIVREMQDLYPYAWMLFSTFLVFTSFILYSLIVAVVCDAVKVTEHKDEEAFHEKEQEDMEFRLEQMRTHVQSMAKQQAQMLKLLQKSLEEVEQRRQSSCQTIKVKVSSKGSKGDDIGDESSEHSIDIVAEAATMESNNRNLNRDRHRLTRKQKSQSFNSSFNSGKSLGLRNNSSNKSSRFNIIDTPNGDSYLAQKERLCTSRDKKLSLARTWKASLGGSNLFGGSADRIRSGLQSKNENSSVDEEQSNR